jgi:hypothetical protein
MLAPATGAASPSQTTATAPAGSAAATPPGADEKAEDSAAGGGSTGGEGNPSNVEPATPMAGGPGIPSGLATPTSNEAQPAPAPDAPVASGGFAPGTGGSASSGVAPVIPTVVPEVSAPGLGVGLRVSVEQSDGLDAWRLAEIGIGALVVALAAIAAGGWYMRHREGAGS